MVTQLSTKMYDRTWESESTSCRECLLISQTSGVNSTNGKHAVVPGIEDAWRNQPNALDAVVRIAGFCWIARLLGGWQRWWFMSTRKLRKKWPTDSTPWRRSFYEISPNFFLKTYAQLVWKSRGPWKDSVPPDPGPRGGSISRTGTRLSRKN